MIKFVLLGCLFVCTFATKEQQASTSLKKRMALLLKYKAMTGPYLQRCLSFSFKERLFRGFKLSISDSRNLKISFQGLLFILNGKGLWLTVTYNVATFVLFILQRFVENANVGACHNELLMLEHGEVQSILKLRATSCLFSAIENSHDAVEITSLDPEKPELRVEVCNKNF